MTRDPHLVQAGDAPVAIGEGTDDLVCACGDSVLVKGYQPSSLLGIDISCARCGAVTTTPGLTDDALPPPAAARLERRTTPLPQPLRLTAGVVAASQEAMDAIKARWSPRRPERLLHPITTATLDEVAAAYDRLTEQRLATDLAAVAAAGGGAHAGLRDYPLAWALQRLRDSVRSPSWIVLASDEDMVATTHVAAFRHFLAGWSHHPLFPQLAELAAGGGFSLHALALSAAAECLDAANNRVGFTVPPDGSRRVSGLYLALGPMERLGVQVTPFGAFAWPHGRMVEPAAVRAAVGEALAASQARINLRNPGLLVLSGGAARAGLEDPLLPSMAQALRVQGKRHRGLAGMAALFPKFGPSPSGARNEVSFGYTFMPLANRAYAARETVALGSADPALTA